jgi:hypothetical protein
VRRLLPVLVLLAVAPVASAHHRQTPPIVAFTTSGDASLPRLAPPSRKAAAVVVDGTVAVMTPFRNPTTPAFSFTAGTNADPSISANGRVVAWDTDADPLASGAPGRQVVEQSRLVLNQVAVDGSGTSANPALDLAGVAVAFDSTADLASTGNMGARQVFFREFGGPIVQLSGGAGTSRKASIALRNHLVVFESTSDPVSGDDTGVAQIWLSGLTAGTATPITSAAAPSANPSVSNDGRLVVFESRADLAGDGQDTGATQIYAYDTFSKTFARVTDDAGGCADATAIRIMRDWRIGYLCGGAAYFSMLRANERFQVATDGGDTTRIVPQGDAHFLLVATTADLLGGSGTTVGHRVYMVNLYKRPPTSAPSAITWFPTQGIPPL